MNCGLTWPVGISTIFQRPLAIPLHYARRLWKSLPFLFMLDHESAWSLSIDLLNFFCNVCWYWSHRLLTWRLPMLTHWGRVTHICVSKLTLIGSDNGLSPGRHQAIIWTSVGILLIWPLGTKFSEIFIEIQIFLFKKMHLNMSSVKCHPFCLGLNVLTVYMLNCLENKTTYNTYIYYYHLIFVFIKMMQLV